ncbi:hypothetical protein ACFXI0_32600 [Kitasatospora indigofera]|uniref:hypothetical protein n=1 Tax=Kitasatospora indigofera TaxID=67307 RepID=UPI0036AF092C
MVRSHDLQMLVDGVEPVGEMLQVPESVARKAVSVVASYARDAQDCRMLLQVLGLMPDAERETADAAPTPSPGDGAPVVGERRRLRS